MRTRGPFRRQGQAAIEFAVATFVFALVVSALTGFAAVFLRNVEMLGDARTDAGIAALDATDGSRRVGSAAGIAAYAHPTVATTAGERPVDPWQEAVDALPAETRFAEWQANAVVPVSLIQGSAKKTFTFRLTLNGEPIFEDEGHLAEEVWLPALGGIRTPGVGGGP
ncbi:MAG: hypothetical protein ACI4Q3_02655 [Kiritimatiellia bacterium]